MRERTYKGFLIFDIDSNGDNYTSFEKAVDIIRSLSVFNEQKYYSGFFDDALLWFNYDGIDIKLGISFHGNLIQNSTNIRFNEKRL